MIRISREIKPQIISGGRNLPKKLLSNFPQKIGRVWKIELLEKLPKNHQQILANRSPRKTTRLWTRSKIFEIFGLKMEFLKNPKIRHIQYDFGKMAHIFGEKNLNNFWTTESTKKIPSGSF